MSWTDHPGWFDQENYDSFARLSLPPHPVILESGTYCGRSTTAFAEIWPEAEIITCDPIDELLRVLPKQATYLQGTGAAIPFDRPIDLLFIDNSHLYVDNKADFERFYPRIKPGGYAVFHDYFFEGDGAAGVKEYVDELMATHDITLDSSGRYGLAILRKTVDNLPE